MSKKELLENECEIPKQLLDFYCFLLGGHERRRRISEGCIKKTNSLAEVLIHKVTNGFIQNQKPQNCGHDIQEFDKQQIIEIINKYGHCCSYHVIEELETAATTRLLNRSKICRNEICKRQDLFTGVASIGIIYQTVLENEELTEEISEQLQNPSEDGECTGELSVSCVHAGYKRKRTLDYPRVNTIFQKAQDELLSLSHHLRNEAIPASLEIIYEQKFL
ncbi:hypothetical protein HHI36_009897 [Cryptolaemus montrouzieri]|uniref:Uncharacterized protein n=1 Tax=Cryptolaemus montrouzieri TaxID=559131 RepID=A0ABD2MH86_9CUCU